MSTNFPKEPNLSQASEPLLKPPEPPESTPSTIATALHQSTRTKAQPPKPKPKHQPATLEPQHESRTEPQHQNHYTKLREQISPEPQQSNRTQSFPNHQDWDTIGKEPLITNFVWFLWFWPVHTGSKTFSIFWATQTG